MRLGTLDEQNKTQKYPPVQHIPTSITLEVAAYNSSLAEWNSWPLYTLFYDELIECWVNLFNRWSSVPRMSVNFDLTLFRILVLADSSPRL